MIWCVWETSFPFFGRRSPLMTTQWLFYWCLCKMGKDKGSTGSIIRRYTRKKRLCNPFSSSDKKKRKHHQFCVHLPHYNPQQKTATRQLYSRNGRNDGDKPTTTTKMMTETTRESMMMMMTIMTTMTMATMTMSTMLLGGLPPLTHVQAGYHKQNKQVLDVVVVYVVVGYSCWFF